ncbi:neutral zinc metallopeptidase [Nocardiopsis aegyptia]|uniref:neutral zinc metallopeptidase n=1 Tax=Nocardiopsis aegyptia TaxID=220378 RepID=UPI003671142E
MENRPGGGEPPGAAPSGPQGPGPAHHAARAPWPAPTAYPAPGYGAYRPPPWHMPPPPPRPSGESAAGVLFGAGVAAAVALSALGASVLIVVNTPREAPPTGGTDLSLHYEDTMAAPPNAVTVDVADHPLYEAPMPEPVDCETPELQPESDESWEGFATSVGGCLEELWAPVLTDLGLAAEAPEFAVTTESPDPADAEGYTLAYYEGDFTRITVVLPNVRELGAQVRPDEREEVWLALMGHEYGHHVQHATGILGISHDLRVSAGTEADELDALRRTELQAECMAGIGLRGITDGGADTLEVVNANFNGGGDLPTHGTAVNRAFWLEQGWSQPTVGSCNTYGAEEDQVL